LPKIAGIEKQNHFTADLRRLTRMGIFDAGDTEGTEKISGACRAKSAGEGYFSPASQNWRDERLYLRSTILFTRKITSPKSQPRAAAVHSQIYRNKKEAAFFCGLSS
jgi:hypothetical protein